LAEDLEADAARGQVMDRVDQVAEILTPFS